MRRLLLILLIGCATACSPSPGSDAYFARCLKTFDTRTGQKPVETYAEAEALLRSFETVKFGQLDPAYVKEQRMGELAKQYRSKTFYRVRGEQQFKFIAGTNRVLDLLPKDKNNAYARLKKTACVKGKPLPDRVLLLDPKVLKRFFQLREALKDQGYQHNELKLTSGFRPPRQNEEEGGAPTSKHLMGIALDFDVGDIDGKNGIDECVDKKIVLDILEGKVMRTGGLGLYPGTKDFKLMGVHIDVRPRCTRWFRVKTEAFEARCDWYQQWARPKNPDKAQCIRP